jgi:hypothetical protein
MIDQPKTCTERRRSVQNRKSKIGTRADRVVK